MKKLNFQIEILFMDYMKNSPMFVILIHSHAHSGKPC